MDKSWISKPKSSGSYKNGVDEFLRFASQDPPEVGKVICPCNRCRNSAILKRSTARKHLLNHGFDRCYTRWIFHGDFDRSALTTEGSIELPEKNDEDVNRGDDSKSPEEPGDPTGQPKHAENRDSVMPKLDEEPGQHKSILIADPYHQKNATTALSPELPKEGNSELTEKSDGDVNRGNHSKPTKEPGDTTSHPNPAKDKGKAPIEQDEGSGSDQIDIWFSNSEEEQHQGPDDQKVSTLAVQSDVQAYLLNVLYFAYDLYTMRVKYGCDKETLDYLMRSLAKRFPLFESLPLCFNNVCSQLNLSAHMPTEHGSSSSNKVPVLEQQGRNRWRCYACGQEIKPGASARTSFRRGKRNKKQPWKKNDK
ncbi:hypothetical protein MLD38_013457 [Melastoma candidum]|uniref:Uncharacterized protein n=1 Tax=Melastoma candidum TaxID=119954 RepID=A0ACB9RA84_9MYRT|nr:hypothetical protein MLD38_013457 [Melastoma candidum]